MLLWLAFLAATLKLCCYGQTLQQHPLEAAYRVFSIDLCFVWLNSLCC